MRIIKEIFVPQKCFRGVFFSTGHRQRPSPLQLMLTLHKTGEDGNFLRQFSKKEMRRKALGKRANESSSNRNKGFSLLSHTDKRLSLAAGGKSTRTPTTALLLRGCLSRSGQKNMCQHQFVTRNNRRNKIYMFLRRSNENIAFALQTPPECRPTYVKQP